ncbi:hypothetical protein VTJ04DRAFT_8877 [Mycothermus thermophilus]|uniref:uncharacterized protein n=1 Tax=Humicola insolens TaxID=85995 RepID=UPI0037420706
MQTCLSNQSNVLRPSANQVAHPPSFVSQLDVTADSLRADQHLASPLSPVHTCFPPLDHDKVPRISVPSMKEVMGEEKGRRRPQRPATIDMGELASEAAGMPTFSKASKPRALGGCLETNNSGTPTPGRRPQPPIPPSLKSPQRRLDEYHETLVHKIEDQELDLMARMPLEQKRTVVSPIKEEGAPLSPSHLFPLDLSDSSTPASTESGNTVRGPPTRDRMPMMTPSYPFPRMEASPSIPAAAGPHSSAQLMPVALPEASRRLSAAFRISDTVTASSTPTPWNTAFFPPGSQQQTVPDHPDYPSPSIPELTLMLSAEPGLDAWWNAVVQIMVDTHKADRVTLTVPADPTDIENVPWALKATYSTLRPAQMDSRNGNEARRTSLGDGLENHNHDSSNSQDVPSWELPFVTPKQSHGGVLQGLRPLDHEAEPLIDHNGVLRILERGSVVALTRTSSYNTPEPNAKAPLKDLSGHATRAKANNNSSRSDSLTKLSSLLGGRIARDQASKKSSMASRLDGEPPKVAVPRYEEYEQAPPSPWSQSPAPTPSAKADPPENPFFTDAVVDEETFNPPHGPPNYSAMGPAEAIGVDNSWTVLHIPLIQMLPSKLNPSFHLDPSRMELKMAGRKSSNASSFASLSPGLSVKERHAPVAILSILSPVIPYPSNLRHSLEQLAPHLAATFSLARHYTNLETELNGLKMSIPRARSLVADLTESPLPEVTSPLSESSVAPTPLERRSSLDEASGGRKRSVVRPEEVRRKRSGSVDSRIQINGHIQLHPSLADATSSFSSLTQSPSPPMTRTPHVASPARAVSVGDPDMTPPSDRLKGLILDSLPAHVFVALPHTGEIVWVNNRFLSYRGQTSSDLAADPWGSIHPDDKDDYLRSWNQCVRTGEQFARTVRIRRFDGVYRWFYARAVASRDKRGVIQQFLGSYMDIHDQHVAELKAARQEEVLASEAKHRLLANLIPQIIFTATEGEGITFANDQWLSYTGQDFDSALGLGFMDHVHPDDLAKCRIPFGKQDAGEKGRENLPDTSADAKVGGPTLSAPNLEELAKNGVIKTSTDSSGRLSYTTEIRLRSKTGEYRWHLIRCVEIDNVDFGSGGGSYFGSATDINDLKLLESKLKEAMDSKGRFLSNMSHEIRTPLIGITGMVSFLQGTPLTEEQRDYTNTIQTSANSLLMIINDILDLSKVDAGMMKLKHEWFHTRSLIEDVNELVSTMAIAKRLELNYVVDGDVPAWVKGDKVRIRQVLLNVIGNAIKFTSQGEVFSRCRIAGLSEQQQGSEPLRPDQIMLEFSVVDTGRGFTEKEAELIFKPFSQIDGSSTRQTGGSGLGLVISRQLVELHGGKMVGTAVPGKGSTFTFTAKFGLPTEDDHPDGTAVPEPPAGYGFNLFHDALPSVESPDSSVPTVSESSPASTSPSCSSDISGSQAHSRLTTPSPAFSAKCSSGTSFDTETPVYSILVVCPLTHSREATIAHVKTILPKGKPYQITSASTLPDVARLLSASSSVSQYTHILINLPSAEDILALVTLIAPAPTFQPPSATRLVILSDSVQRQAVAKLAGGTPLEALLTTTPTSPGNTANSKTTYIYKPVKPSRLAVLFGPACPHDSRVDLNRSSAQRVVEDQRRCYLDLARRLGGKGLRVLLVEDNPVNQKVLRKYLERVGLAVEVAGDGVEGVERIVERGAGWYSIVLCDLHMPRKDGYQACREIRAWEARQTGAEGGGRQNNTTPQLPIIALSANVMSDVHERCVEAGFSDYLTKPVDFIDLSRALEKYL